MKKAAALIVTSLALISCSSADKDISGNWECTNCTSIDNKLDSLIITRLDNSYTMQHIEPNMTSNFFGGIAGSSNPSYRVISGALTINENRLELASNPTELFTLDKINMTISYSAGNTTLVYKKIEPCTDKTIPSIADLEMAPKLIQSGIGECKNLTNANSCKKQECFNVNIASIGLNSKITQLDADIHSLRIALQLYKLNNGQYPTTEQGLAALVTKPTIAPIPPKYQGSYVEKIPLDPWGKSYVYKMENNQISLYSSSYNQK